MANRAQCGFYAFHTLWTEYTNNNESVQTFSLRTYLTSVKNGEKSEQTVEAVAIKTGDTVCFHKNVPNGFTGTIRLWERNYSTDGTFTTNLVLDETGSSLVCPMGPR